MADQFTFEAIFNFAIKGAQSARADARGLTGSLDEMYRAGQLTDKQYERLSKSAIQAGKANEAAANATQGGVRSYQNLQFSLNNAAFALAAFGAAAGAISAAPFAVAIQFEKDFAQVARTSGVTGQELEKLRGQFIGLAQSLPTSFTELTEVGALGGQLNIANDQLTEFVSTVAKLTAASDLTAEAAGTALARIGQLTGTSDDFNALGSAIAFVGVNSVATESQIVKTANNIASIGQQAGFSAPEIIGFAGALASLGVPPELSRGTLERTFTQISKAVSEGGSSLESFASIAGLSSQDFAAAFSPGGNSAQALTAFITGLGGLSEKGIDARSALRELGITSVRDVPTLLKLAQNSEVLAQSLEDAGIGFSEATELNRQFAIVSETTASRLLNLKNNFDVFLDSIGSNGLGVIDSAITAIADLLKTLTDFANSSPLEGIGLDISGGDILAFGAAVTGAVAVLALLFAATARAASGVIALGTALSALGAPAGIASAGLGGVAATATASGTAAGGAAVGFRALGTAIKAIGLIGLLTALPAVSDALGKVVNKVRDFDDSLDGSLGRLQSKGGLSGAFGLVDASGNVDEFTASLDRAIANTVGFGHGILQVTTDVKAVDDALAELVKGGSAEEAAGKFDLIKEAAKAQGVSVSELRNLYPEYFDALKTTGDASATAATGVDAVSEAMTAAEEATNAAVDAVRNYNSELFGNANAQAAFYESIDSGNKLLTDSTFNLTQATKDSGSAFDLTTESGRKAQSALFDLAQSGNDAAASLGEAGATGEELDAQYKLNVESVRALGRQFGLSDDALDTFVQTYVASPKQLNYNMQMQGIQASQDALNAFYRANDGRTLRTYLETINLSTGRQANGSQVSGGRGGSGGLTFAEGGYTGRGGKYDPAGIVHRGEYVVPKKFVNQSTGLPYADALNRLSRGTPAPTGYANGGFASGGLDGAVVELGPKSLARVGQQAVNFILDSNILASSVNRTNANNAYRGGGR